MTTDHSNIPALLPFVVVELICDATLMITTNLKLFVYDRRSLFIRVYAYVFHIPDLLFSFQREKNCTHVHIAYIHVHRTIIHTYISSTYTNITYIPFRFAGSVLSYEIVLVSFVEKNCKKTKTNREKERNCVVQQTIQRRIRLH